MADQSTLIIQVLPGSAVDRQLSTQPPASVASGEVVVEVGPTDAGGHLEPAAVGEVVFSLPSPESLKREAGEIRRVISGAGAGLEPLVIVVEAADELRDDELAALLGAKRDTSRAVVLCIMGDG
jgi:hypothetical protein